MIDEYKLNSQVNRGEQSKRIMQNPLVIDAFDVVEKTILDAWKESPADDEKGRYHAYLMYRLLKNLRQQFEIAIATGNVARKELLQIKQRSRFRRIVNA